MSYINRITPIAGCQEEKRVANLKYLAQVGEEERQSTVESRQWAEVSSERRRGVNAIGCAKGVPVGKPTANQDQTRGAGSFGNDRRRWGLRASQTRRRRRYAATRNDNSPRGGCSL